jgi:hypothetical protein
MNRRRYSQQFHSQLLLAAVLLIHRMRNQSPRQTNQIHLKICSYPFQMNEVSKSAFHSRSWIRTDPIAEKSTMLDPAEGVEVYTGITETGEYPSVFSLNGEQSSIRTT